MKTSPFIAKSPKTLSTKKPSLTKDTSLTEPLLKQKNIEPVCISKKAKLINKAHEIATSEGTNTKKINHLRRLIDEKKYKVNSSNVVDKIVQEHLLTPDS